MYAAGVPPAMEPEEPRYRGIASGRIQVEGPLAFLVAYETLIRQG